MASDSSALVEVNPVELPTAFSIGTRKAFADGYEYEYNFRDDVNAYICDHQTTTNVQGEVLAIQKAYDKANGKTWYLASEGVILEGEGFNARQAVFRTSEKFWQDGQHDWELNAYSSKENKKSTLWKGKMTAFTQVPTGVKVMTAAAGFAETEENS